MLDDPVSRDCPESCRLAVPADGAEAIEMRRMVSAWTREACETMDLTPEEAQAAKDKAA
jgi:hypothetical protein